jgi:ribonuclease HII
MIYPHLEKEKHFWNLGLNFVVGVDEAGRGPLAGPVVAGAVFISPSTIEKVKAAKEFKLVRDSKTLSARQRGIAFDFIVQNFDWGVGFSDEKTVDRINILQASFLAMKKSLSDLKKKLEGDIEIILIDGRSPIPNMSVRQEAIVGGDRDIFSISAASIVAKVTRDRMMLEYDKKFPEYGFEKHKGYGTKFHFEMIEEHGPCEIHRKSFCKKILANCRKRTDA